MPAAAAGPLADHPVPFGMTPAGLRRAAARGVFEVRLPDGTRYPVRMLRAHAEPDGRVSVVGKVASKLGQLSAVLTYGRHAVFGVLPSPDGRSFSVTTSHGVTRIAPSGGLLLPGAPEGRASAPDYLLSPPDGVAAPSRGSRPVFAAGPAQAAGDIPWDTASIDVLGLYSDRILELRGNLDAVRTEVVNKLAIATQAHVDSGSRARFQLVGLEKVVDDPEASNFDQVYDMTDGDLGGTPIGDWRDDAGADVVVLLRPATAGECGSAWVNGADLMGTALASRAYLVVEVDPCGPYVMAHELGHTLGAMHEREKMRDDDVFGFGAYGFSFAYRHRDTPAFATLMGAPDFGDEPRLPIFSSPGSFACGARCGASNGSTDNARTVERMAGAIAGLRGAPGTISVVDAVGGELRTGKTSSITVPVRISGEAPPGGVSFTVEAAGGSATPGIDYKPMETHYTIPAGGSSVDVYITVVGDEDVEGDEFISLRLADVTGVAVDDAEAIAVIADDDPRPMIHGRLRFEPGAQVPDEGVTVYLDSTYLNGSAYAVASESTVAMPPDFEFEMPGTFGANGIVSASMPEPFAVEHYYLYDIFGDRTVNLHPVVGARVHGRLRMPAGAAPLDGFEQVQFAVAEESGYSVERSLDLVPPDYAYSYYVLPGSVVDLRVRVNGTMYPYWKRMEVYHDVQSDLQLSTLPSLVAWAERSVEEGSKGETGKVVVHFEFSAPADAKFSYHTVSGSALAGSDFQSVSGSFDSSYATGFTREIPIYGDDAFEPGEWFQVVLDDVQGAVSTSPPPRIEILDDDVHAGGPGQTQAVP